MGRPLNFDFFVISVYYKKLGSGLKLTVPKYRPDPWSRLEDIVKRVCTVELKPIVVTISTRKSCDVIKTLLYIIKNEDIGNDTEYRY